MALSIKEIDKGLRATGGFTTYAAKKLGVTYQAIHARIKRSPYLQRTLLEIRESYLDLTEHALIQKIKSEDLGAICFFLKCKGKERGYTEKSALEVSGPDGGPIETKVDAIEYMKKRGIPIPDIGIEDIEEN